MHKRSLPEQVEYKNRQGTS